MAASDYVPIFFKNRLHLVGRPQMSHDIYKARPAATDPEATDRQASLGYISVRRSAAVSVISRTPTSNVK
jgi:hypothetical protein